MNAQLRQPALQFLCWKSRKGIGFPLPAMDRYIGEYRHAAHRKALDVFQRQIHIQSIFETNYCSNNFEECRLWNGIDPTSANIYFDHNIKQEYNAVQLLEYYRQGLELQSRLVELYYKRQGKDGR